ncbi:hypothetical protein BDZ94DRAFT_283386 [Collybia nuda]|uniref:Uncharacterized protein n=1 Tax=Collybia nuda TaxID=64659 RepID=A0A9P6CMS8_9AGAR|nr:hypothetical protein BDZ94DRAFT_283386 [Collybia nuda]
MPYSLPRKLKFLSIKFRRSRSSTDGETQIQGKLGATIQALTFAEKIAESSSVPFLKGAIGVAIVVAECVRGYQSNNAALEKLALSCAQLMIDISKRVEAGPDISEDLRVLIADLFGTLEEVKNFATRLSSGNKLWRALTQQEIKDQVNDYHRDLDQAHRKFQTLSIIVKDQSEASQDIIYPHGNIEAGEIYTTGNEWVAFSATLVDSGRLIMVKRYMSDDASRRKTMYIQDQKAFKKNWYPHLVSYMGSSGPREEYPYVVLSGGNHFLHVMRPVIMMPCFSHI